jgi:hypothetical protein
VECVLVVKAADRMVFEGVHMWADAESIAFRTLSCTCGAVIGCKTHSASKKDAEALGDMPPRGSRACHSTVLQMLGANEGEQLKLNFVQENVSE